MLSSLEQSILSALVYFDVFEYPLTLLEIHRLLFSAVGNERDNHCSLSQVRQALLESGRLKSVIRFKNGFFYLRGREQTIRTRSQRLLSARSKLRRARRVSRLLSWLPFVRMIAVCNSLSYNNAREGSDIDLFVASRAGGVWWARFFSFLVLKLLRLRPQPGRIRDKICLSFFVDSAHLNIETIKLGPEDIYLPFWLSTLLPLYDIGGCYQRLWSANRWLKNYLPNSRLVLTGLSSFRARPAILKIAFEQALLPFTFVAAFLQRRAFPRAIQELINQDSRVRVAEGILKFHTNDRRAEYARLFKDRLAGILPVVSKSIE